MADSSQTIDYVTLLIETEGESYPFFEHETYSFTNRTFVETDQAGVYTDFPEEAE